MPRVLIGSIAARRDCISLAALLVKGHRQDALRPDLPGRDQPGDARGQDARLAAAGTGKNQGMLRWQRDGGQLWRIEIGEQIGHGEGFPDKAALDYNGRAVLTSACRSRNGGGRHRCVALLSTAEWSTLLIYQKSKKEKNGEVDSSRGD
jgi:hypothetical protein